MLGQRKHPIVYQPSISNSSLFWKTWSARHSNYGEKVNNSNTYTLVIDRQGWFHKERMMMVAKTKE